MTVVIDADVLIGALDATDPHHSRAQEMFVGWARTETGRAISAVNLSEVLVAPALDPRKLRAARRAIATLGVMIQLPDETIAVDAARLRSVHPISLADGYCLATARRLDVPVFSFDRKVAQAARSEKIASV